jgi:Flp pilus assembly protein protease CpaA
MEFGFLFWLFFVGIVVASLQDLKRREVDNFLNLFLLSSSLVYVFCMGFFTNDVGIIFLAIASLIILFVFMNAFYYGGVFAGGDAKLLFAMSAFFVGISFFETFFNIGIFLFLLMLSGSVYGLAYSSVLYFRDFRRVNKEIRKAVIRPWARVCVIFGAALIFLGIFSWPLLIFGILFFLLPILYVFAKGLETVCMVKVVKGSELREGDWLVDDVRVGKKVIRANFEGLSLEDIKLLRKRNVKIKEGLPFVPAFLIAFLIYVFSKDYIFFLIFS